MLIAPIFLCDRLKGFSINDSISLSNSTIEKNKIRPGDNGLKSLNYNFDPHRLSEIYEVINGIYRENQEIPHDSYQIFPIDIVKIIEGYEQDQSLIDIYNTVIDKLKLSQTEKNGLNFYKKDFAKRLYSIVSLKKIPSCTYDSLRHDIVKLLFKWMIHMRQKLIDNDHEFNKISETILPIASMIKEISISMEFPIGFKLGPKDSFIPSMFDSLIKTEFFENPSIFSILASAIQYFYLDQDGMENGKREIDCNELKNKYFNGKRFESNILLKYLIVIYDPREAMRKCIIDGDLESSKLRISPLKDKITPSSLDNLKLKGIEDFGIAHEECTSKSIVEFFLLTNRKFQILTSCTLIHILKKLKEMNLLKKEIMESILKFDFDLDDSTIQYKEEFEKFLLEYLEYFYDQEDKIQECNEYLEILYSDLE